VLGEIPVLLLFFSWSVLFVCIPFAKTCCAPRMRITSVHRQRWRAHPNERESFNGEGDEVVAGERSVKTKGDYDWHDTRALPPFLQSNVSSIDNSSSCASPTTDHDRMETAVQFLALLTSDVTAFLSSSSSSLSFYAFFLFHFL
jgi:hypothetical protein